MSKLDLTWRTEPTEYTDTIHYTDDYVVHGRGFIVNDDIWFDEYDVHLAHTHFWNNVISKEYGYPEYKGSWSAFVEEQLDKRPLYWSTTGSDTFILQAPCVDLMTDEHWEQLRVFVEDEFNFPEFGNIHFYEKPRDRNSHTNAVLQALRESDRNQSNDNRLPDWLDTYKACSVKENEI